MANQTPNSTHTPHIVLFIWLHIEPEEQIPLLIPLTSGSNIAQYWSVLSGPSMGKRYKSRSCCSAAIQFPLIKNYTAVNEILTSLVTEVQYLCSEYYSSSKIFPRAHLPSLLILCICTKKNRSGTFLITTQSILAAGFPYSRKTEGSNPNFLLLKLLAGANPEACPGIVWGSWRQNCAIDQSSLRVWIITWQSSGLFPVY